MGSIRWTQGSPQITNPTPLRLGSKLPSLVAPPLKGRGEDALLKPLLFRGGVGVGSLRRMQRSAQITIPTPLRLGSKLPSLVAPPLKGRGELTPLKSLKPLSFRGGVGVGSIRWSQRSTQITNPTPLRLGSKLPSLVAPPLKRRGEAAPLKGCVRQVLQIGGHGAGHAACRSSIFLCSRRSSMLR